MAKGKKTGGRDFKPGESGNPDGGPGLPQELREARKLNQRELERVVNKYLHASDAELLAVAKDPKAIIFDKIVCSIMLAAVDDADHHRMEWVLQRMLGKVKDQLEVTTPVPFILHKLDGSQVIMGAKVDEEKD